MTAIHITCRPADGILRTTAETIAALDALALTLPHDQPWEIHIHVGHTPADTVVLTARTATDPTYEEHK